MNTITINELDEMDFSHAYNITINTRNILEFIDAPDNLFLNNNAASVYMWLSPRQENANVFDVKYIGKAGYGIARRVEQHAGGFRNSSTGKKNRDLILPLLNSGRTLQVYARQSDVQSILGFDVPLYATEEQALCERFSPEWNRAKFPSAVTTSESIQVNFSDMYQHDEINNFISALEDADVQCFNRILSFLHGHAITDIFDQKVVGGYTNQPQHCNGIPVITFCRLGQGGNALANSWIARIPLKTPLTIVFPLACISSACSSDKILTGVDNFCPRDINDFLAHPENYLNLTVLRERIEAVCNRQ